MCARVRVVSPGTNWQRWTNVAVGKKNIHRETSGADTDPRSILNAEHFKRYVGSLKTNSLSVPEKLQRCLFHEAFHSSGSSCVLCLGRLPSTGTGRASDIGAGRREPANSRSISRSPFLFFCLLFRNSLSFTLTRQPPPLYSSCVTVQGFFPPSPIHLSLAGIILTRCSRCEVARGGREGSRAGHLTVRSLPCWHDPQYVLRARTHMHARTNTHTHWFSQK